MATGALNTAQQLTFALGIATLGGLFTHPDTPIAGVQLTLGVSGVVGLVGAILVPMLMRPRAGYKPRPWARTGQEAASSSSQ